jgi:hypothetical protein
LRYGAISRSAAVTCGRLIDSWRHPVIPNSAGVPILLDSVLERGFATQVAVLDKGYDGQPMHDVCESRGIRPVIALKETPAVKRGEHKPRHASTASGRSRARTPSAASKWRCPSGECQPMSVWVKASRLHPLIPHGTERWKFFYRQRTSVERGFRRLKNDYGLLPLRVRRIMSTGFHQSNRQALLGLR